MLAPLTVFGPGLVTLNAGNDAGGVTTYSVAGARYGLDLLWALPIVTISLIVTQEACVRLAAVTGKGLADLIRERFGVRWTLIVMFSFLAASIGTTTAEFAGLAAVGELFGIPRETIVFAAFALVVYLVIRGSYARFERVFVAMTVVYFAYVATALLVTPDWLPVLRASFVPSLRLDSGYLFLLVGVIGTTVTSYMQFFIASAVSAKGARPADLPRLRTDVVLSTIFADLIALFIVVTTAETLFPAGIPVENATQAAQALAPLAGPHATQLFAVGIIGASLIGASVVPVSASFAVCEAFGWEHGMSQRFRDAPIFQGLFVLQLIIGGVVVLLPNVSLVGILVSTQVLDGVLLPVTLVAIARLVGDQGLMGRFASRGPALWIIWITAGSLSALSVLLLVVTVINPG